MGQVEDDGQPNFDLPPLPASEPPYQALAPNLDKVSRSSFSKGTVSRGRINRALAGFAVIVVVIALIVIGSAVLTAR